MPFFTHLRKQRPDVLAALHAQAKSEAWVECHSRVGRELGSVKDPSSITVLPRLLERIPVLLFAGDQDFICNYLGQESLIQALTWNGGTGLEVRTGFPRFNHKHNYLWQEVETQTWTVGDTPAGTWVSSRNLTYVKVVSNMIFLFDAKWPILPRSLTLRIWPGTINCMQRTT
jgi:carboxypeptidase D